MKIENGKIVIDIQTMIQEMSDSDKQAFLEIFTVEEILNAIEAQLRGQTTSWWTTILERDGGKIREQILKIQGLEPEYKKDLEHKIKGLEFWKNNYQQYYDWYFKLYHYDQGDLFRRVINAIGKPEQEAKQKGG